MAKPKRKTQLDLIAARQALCIIGERLVFRYQATPNPNRRWWQFWKPKIIVKTKVICKGGDGATLTIRRPPAFEISKGETNGQGKA